MFKVVCCRNCHMRERVNAIFNNLSVILLRQPEFTYPIVSHTSSPHNSLSKQPDVFPHGLLVCWWKTYDTCRIDFCRMFERMLAELGLELTTLEWQPAVYSLSYLDWASSIYKTFWVVTLTLSAAISVGVVFSKCLLYNSIIIMLFI